MKTKKLGLSVVALLIIGLFSFIYPASAVNEHQVFIGAQEFTHYEYALSSPMEYGFHVSLFSTLDVPSSWYLQYTMGFYLTNSSGTGYYVGLHQYRGLSQIYVNPVISGVAFGLDGQASNFYSGAPSHLGLVYTVPSLYLNTVTVDYNSTSEYFSIRQNNYVLVENYYSGSGFTFYKYAVENPFGRTGITGTVAFSSYGPDYSNGTYTNPQYIGVDFKTLTDGQESSEGGVINWNSSTFPLGQTGFGTAGFVGNLSIGDGLGVLATPAQGYSFAHFYVMNNYTGQFFPAGYYDLGGRLIANPDFTHIYATEEGDVITQDNSLVFIGSLNPRSGAGFTYSDYAWTNASSLSNVGFPLVLINSAYYDLVTNFEAWFGGSASVNPQSCGIQTGNPIYFNWWGQNTTIFASFTSINYNPNSIGPGAPNPTVSNTGPIPNVLSFSFASINTGVWMIVYMVVGAFLTLAGVAILIKASDAWPLGIALLVAGFFTSVYGQPNLLGPGAFGIEAVMFTVMLYTGRGIPRSK